MLSRFEKLSQVATILAAVSIPFILWGAISIRSGAARVHDWLPDHRIERIEYDQFVSWFGDDQYVLLTWDGCSPKDQRLELLRQHLLELNQASSLFESVETTETVLHRLTSPPLQLDRRLAEDRLRGVMLGKQNEACLVAQLSKQGIEGSAKTIQQIRNSVDSIDGLDRQSVFMVGTLFEEVAVDEAGDRSLRYLVPPSTLFAIIVAMIVLRKWRSSLLVFLLAGLGQLSAAALVYYTGGEFSAVMIVLPTLVFMLTLSSAVHLVNYYGDVKPGEHRGVRTLLIGAMPTVLASLTTMLGMGSLAVSELAPVRSFGLYSAIALGIATAMTLLIFPALADYLLKRNSPAIQPIPTNPIDSNASDTSYHAFDATRYAWITQKLSAHATGIVLASIALLVLTTYGATQLKSSTKFDHMFSTKSPTIQGIEWVENHLGPMASIEVLVQFPQQEFGTIQEVRWLNRLALAIRQDEKISATISAADFLPAVPQAKGIRATTVRAAYESKLKHQLPELVKQDWLAETDEQRIWRITCKVTSLQEDYGFFVDRIQTVVDQTLAKHALELNPPTHITITGLSPLAHQAQASLIYDLGSSFLMAFGLITPVMMLIARSWTVGLLLMIPNVLPITFVFGTIGLLGRWIDIASILTASIALGIAVDDTLHYVSWYSRGRGQGKRTLDSIAYAYHHCGIAMMETTLISCSAMLPFLFADFVPTQRFATLMIAILSLALVGDLLILPALLIWHDRLRKTTSPAAQP